MRSQIRYGFKILDEWWVKKLPEIFLGGHKVSFAVQNNYKCVQIAATALMWISWAPVGVGGSRL